MSNYNYFKNINLEEIEKLDKITLVKISDFGFPIVANLKRSKTSQLVFFKKYAQYDKCIQVQGLLPRKRKASAFLIRPTDEFAIYEGTITEDMFKSFKTITKDDNVTIESWGMCFSDGALDEFISGCDIKPLLTYKD